MIAKRHFGSLEFYGGALAIAVPVMLQALLQSMVSLIDNFMVAGLGDVSMSGVNVANQFTFVFFVALNTVMITGGMFMSQFFGAKDPAGMKQVFRFKILASAILGLVVVFLSLAFPRQILGLLVNKNTARDVIVAEGTRYLVIVAISFVPIVASTSIAASFREIGRVKPPLVISVLSTLVNTFFNWVFIYGNLGAPRMDVQGAAIATVIARTFELVLFVAFARKAKPPFLPRMRELLAVDFRVFASIFRKSGMIFLSEMSWVLTETVMTAVYNGRGGAAIVSGMAAGWTIANLFFLVFGGIHTSIGVIVGGTLGKNELDSAREQARWLMSGSVVMGAIVAVFEVASVVLIPIVFGNLSSEARHVTRNLLWVIAVYMPLWTFLNAQFATARAGGDAIMGVWVDAGVNTALFLPGIFLLAGLTDLGPIGIYAIVKVSDIAKAIIAQWQLNKERWVKNLTTLATDGGSLE